MKASEPMTASFGPHAVLTACSQERSVHPIKTRQFRYKKDLTVQLRSNGPYIKQSFNLIKSSLYLDRPICASSVRDLGDFDHLLKMSKDSYHMKS
jgi:hypothetical protein